MPYLPPPIWANHTEKKAKPEPYIQLITIETRRDDGSTYLATIFPPSKNIEKPNNDSSFTSCMIFVKKLLKSLF